MKTHFSIEDDIREGFVSPIGEELLRAARKLRVGTERSHGDVGSYNALRRSVSFRKNKNRRKS